jgi:VWFA-related protein
MRKVSKISLSLLLFIWMLSAARGQQSASAAGPTEPASAPAAAVAPAHISLDVVVTDKAGKAAPDLEPMDFKLLDNNEPRKILSYRRTDGTVGSKFDPPVEVIVLLDAVNLPYQAVTLLRLEVERFLRQNGGKLAQPVSIFMYTSSGLMVQPAPSRDGNAMAKVLDESTGTVRSRGSAAGVFGEEEQFQSSVETLAGIADNETKKPGRKMLIWIGSGWPLLETAQYTQSNESRESDFKAIVRLSKKLREARVTVYSIYTLNSADGKFLYQAYLKPVTVPRKAEPANLALQVLVTQTGGRVLESSNDIAGQIDSCISDIGAYYTLSFAPPTAAQANEYHGLKVEVDKPGLTARTMSGYYLQP